MVDILIKNLSPAELMRTGMSPACVEVAAMLPGAHLRCAEPSAGTTNFHHVFAKRSTLSFERIFNPTVSLSVCMGQHGLVRTNPSRVKTG